MASKERTYPVNLPKTDFSMKAELPKKEPSWIAFWEKMGLYQKLLDSKKTREKFILHDGPPYANGSIHMGHALNKTLKDIIVRYKNLSGFKVPFVPGWDCHGLPIEQALLKELGLSQKEARKDPVRFRQKCREFVLSMIELQREDFKRLGLLGDWANPYITMELPYAAKIVEAFIRLYQQGYIYQGLKPVFWCVNCETALAQAEIEYTEKSSPSIYVSFDVVEPKEPNTSLVIWTTTPWTLPANRAVCVHSEALYRVLETKKGQKLLVLDNLADKLASLFEAQKTQTIFKSQELSSWRVKSPLAPDGKNIVPVIHDKSVELEEGTGIVHIAPGHGEEDFALSRKFSSLVIEVASPVDGSGHFTEEAGHPQLSGLRVNLDKTTDTLLELLGSHLLVKEKIHHSYPHCWRCKQPVIFRATTQWFLNMEHKNLRARLIEAIEKVRWHPSTSKERIKSMVEGRPDWCLSRQRIWGAPIPILYCGNCEAINDSDGLFKSLVEKVAQEGEDFWFSPEALFLEDLGKKFPCPKCRSTQMKRDPNILDVWLDSGVSWLGVLETNPELQAPADLYLEGADQHRGWFQTSLIASYALKGEAPYRAVYTNGWVLDEQGRAMHKSLGNVVSPQEVTRDWGADILRLWAASTQSLEDVRISGRLMSVHAENYKKIRNTIRFMLGNLSDFDPHKDGVALYDSLGKIEQWALFKLYQTIVSTKQAYENFDFNKVLHGILEFSVHDMSNFYFDVSKDRLYTSQANNPDRRAAQSVLFVTLVDYLAMISAILAFTAEEAWQELLKKLSQKEPLVLCNVKLSFPESIHETSFPLACADWKNDSLASQIPALLDARTQVHQTLDIARKDKGLGSSLEAKVELAVSDSNFALFKDWEQLLPSLLIVSDVSLKKDDSKKDGGMTVSIEKAEGKKCARCWIYNVSVGDNPENPDLCAKCFKVLFG